MASFYQSASYLLSTAIILHTPSPCIIKDLYKGLKFAAIKVYKSSHPTKFMKIKTSVNEKWFYSQLHIKRWWLEQHQSWKRTSYQKSSGVAWPIARTWSWLPIRQCKPWLPGSDERVGLEVPIASDLLFIPMFFPWGVSCFQAYEFQLGAYQTICGIYISFVQI